MSDGDTRRIWFAGVLTGGGVALILLGLVASSATLDPVGTVVVGAAFLGFGWWLKRSIDTDGTEQVPVLDNVLDMELDADDDRRYIVLFDEDYEEVIFDGEDSVALLLDCNQAVEVLQLASKTVAALAPEYAPDKEPIDAMIDELQEVRDSDE